MSEWIKTEDALPPEGVPVVTDSFGALELVTRHGDTWYWHEARSESKRGPVHWFLIPSRRLPF